MGDYVRARCERDYGNVSEFFRDLVREKMEREIQGDLRLLAATRTGEPGPSEAEIEQILATQKKVRIRRARRA